MIMLWLIEEISLISQQKWFKNIWQQKKDCNWSRWWLPTGCLLDYAYFEKYYQLIAIYLSKQHKLDADPEAMQQINFTGNLTRAESATIFFIIEKVKETVLLFQKEQLKYYDFILF